MMTSCQSASDIIAIHGVDKEKFTLFRRYEVDDAALEAFRADKSGALVGNRIAARYGWKPGRHVVLEQLNNISFTVRGIFTTRGSADDFVILADRRFLQEALNEQGISNRVLIKLEPGADAAAVREAVEGLPLTVQTTTQPEQEFLAASLDQLADLVAVSRIVIVGIVLVILIAMGNAISMATRQRGPELAILRTLGFQKRTILAMIVSEGALEALLGGTAGCLIVQGLIWGDLIKTVSSCGLTVNLTAGPYAFGVALASIAAAATLGSLVPAWSVSRQKIVTVIRRED